MVYHGNVRSSLNSLNKSAFYFKTCVIFVVENAEIAVSALFVEVETSVALAVKLGAPLHKFFNTVGSLLNHNFNDVFF